jgi:hypothetical protein
MARQCGEYAENKERMWRKMIAANSTAHKVAAEVTWQAGEVKMR